MMRLALFNLCLIVLVAVLGAVLLVKTAIEAVTG